MKKIKVLASSFFVALLLICTSAILSCENNEATISKPNMFYEAVSQKKFSLENQIELNEIAKILAREPKEIKILKDASFVNLTDDQGDYRAISVRYKVGEVTTSLIVPLSEYSFKKSGSIKVEDNINYYVAAPCEMKCTASNCNMCTQTVIERCKSQSCNCEGFSSGCDASIIYPE